MINKKIYNKNLWDYATYLKPEDILGSLIYLTKVNKK